jgi:hypothetical protein
MEIAYQYVKKRADFGHHVTFDDSPAYLLESSPSHKDLEGEYTAKNPVFTTVDTCAPVAEHECNTDLITRRSQGMGHKEGGWPENVDSTEPEQVDRYLKKQSKEHKFKASVHQLSHLAEQSVKQNNTLDIYEQYFDGADTLKLTSEPPSMKAYAVFRDPAPVKRTVTAVNWHPEGTHIAVAYSVLKFQDDTAGAGGRIPASSYVWDLTNSNVPVAELAPPSPLVLSLLPHLASPTASLEDIARELELPRGEVCSAARALCSWGLAFLQPLLTAESVLQVTKNAPFGLLTPVARAFAAAFLGGLATAEHSNPKLLTPLPGPGPGPSSVSVAKASIDPYPPLSAGSQGSWGRGHGQRRLTLGVRGAVADKDARVSADMSAQVLESIPPVSLPVILSVFDGHRPLSEALELIPRSLSTQGLDIVIWLLRRRMVIVLE